ncbi:MAG: SDR family oxidoreductase [Acidobacteria bacterium]|nr:SDR family oxidoreductase [Acidobacteriota bacterium]
MSGLKGKAALVTGAASGIGRSTADLLESFGALVYRADVAEGAGLRLDVTSEGDWQRVVAEIPRLDVLVHSAGIATGAAIEACSVEEWRRTIDVNLTGAFLGLKHMLPLMRQNADGGSVVLIGSASGVKAAAGAAAYCCSKAGLVMLAQCAALEAKDGKIRVNVISPAGVVTPMWKELPEVPDRGKNPLERMAFPDEVAEAVLFLCGDAAGGMTGADLRFDAGYTI